MFYCFKTLNPFNVDFWTLINRGKKTQREKRSRLRDLKLLQIRNKCKSLHKYDRTHLNHHWSSRWVLEVKSHHYKYTYCTSPVCVWKISLVAKPRASRGLTSVLHINSVVRKTPHTRGNSRYPLKYWAFYSFTIKSIIAWYGSTKRDCEALQRMVCLIEHTIEGALLCLRV